MPSGLVASVSGSVARRPFCSATHHLHDLRWFCSALQNRQAIALLHGCCRLWFRLFQRLFSPLPEFSGFLTERRCRQDSWLLCREVLRAVLFAQPHTICMIFGGSGLLCQISKPLPCCMGAADYGSGFLKGFYRPCQIALFQQSDTQQKTCMPGVCQDRSFCVVCAVLGIFGGSVLLCQIGKPLPCASSFLLSYHLHDLRWFWFALPNKQAIALLHGCCRLWFRLFQRLFSPLPDCFVSAERHPAKDVHARCLSGLVASVSGSVARRPFCSATICMIFGGSVLLCQIGKPLPCCMGAAGYGSGFFKGFFRPRQIALFQQSDTQQKTCMPGVCELALSQSLAYCLLAFLPLPPIDKKLCEAQIQSPVRGELRCTFECQCGSVIIARCVPCQKKQFQVVAIFFQRATSHFGLQ